LREQLAKLTLHPPALGEDISAVRGLHPRIPAEYIGLLVEANGGEGWLGNAYVQLYEACDVVSVTQEIRAYPRSPQTEQHFVFFGGDGGGQLLAYDLRRQTPALVLLDTAYESVDDTPWRHRSLRDVLAQVALSGWFPRRRED
jgi:hypothetical protein